MSDVPTDCKNGRRSAFTLMELLTVMAIMFVVMAISIASYFGIARTSALRGAQENLYAVLSLARQHAMIHSIPVHVVFNQEERADGSFRSGFTVLAQEGRHTGGTGSTLVTSSDRWSSGALFGATVYRIRRTGSNYAYDFGEVSQNDTYRLEADLPGGGGLQWVSGDFYGWILHDTEYLPTTLKFDSFPASIVFMSDGTTANRSGGYDVRVVELHGGVGFELQVEGLTGLIEVQEDDED